MKFRSLTFFLLLSILALLLLSTTVQAAEYREVNTKVKAEDILKNIESGKDIYLENCRIVGELNLSNVELKKVSKYNRIPWYYYEEDPDPTDSEEGVVEGNITFINCSFDSDLDFSKALFSRSVLFHEVNCSSNATFGASFFNGTSNFYKTTFNRTSNFTSTNFNDNANFSFTTFRGQTSFKGADFNDTAYFNKVIFGSNSNEITDFCDVGFRHSVYFEETTFNDITNFDSTLFDGFASFQGSIFNNTTSFNEANFHDFTSFQGSIFNNTTSFNETNFHDFASFERSTSKVGSTSAVDTYFNMDSFDGTISFKNVIFKGTSEFLNASFDSPTEFTSVLFNNDALFQGVKFNDRVKFTLVKFQSSTDFSDVAFNDISSFYGVSFKGPTYFGNGTWGYSTHSTTFKYCNFYEVTFNNNADFVGPYSPRNIYSDGESSQTFIEYYKRFGKYDEADTIYYNYRDSSLKHKLIYAAKSKSIYDTPLLIDFLTLITCGYGVRPLNSLYFGMIMTFLFSIIYAKGPTISLVSTSTETTPIKFRFQGPGIVRTDASENQHQKVSFWDALNFSITTFIFMSHNNWDAKDNFRKWATLEGVIGWITLAIFMATLTNVLIRT
ncbi:hypothetical protein MSBRW_0871 [Methanosarcina barkeri str. Wiesmoor]|uniref:Uncharacterized protein n=2 Tax=Methanosarcina barkeri TaxID=2208 RepID=A0A0E3QJZ6_METBA|nr:pentapeptide repeat-containing protein [Methanosarcina barkeri]AKB50124.1 hypothetical protein MSBRW_0871 [Methanosarcina barkeri str. Wiesmoor]